MTPEEAARFILSDCQDPELKQQANADADAALAEALTDPAFARQWRANLQRMANEIDSRIMEDVYEDL